MREKHRIHYVLSTHWDREWYQSFQEFRYRLVKTLDTILTGLEKGDLNGPFQTDGQAIVLEDYLEIRPERRSQVERLLRKENWLLVRGMLCPTNSRSGVNCWSATWALVARSSGKWAERPPGLVLCAICSATPAKCRKS